MHWWQGAQQSLWPPPKKMAVFTPVEREGEARSSHVADVTAKTLRESREPIVSHTS
jgi:hypothetical protein